MEKCPCERRGYVDYLCHIEGQCAIEDDSEMNLRAELGIDGNCGFALLGENIQEGECEFVEIDQSNPDRIRAERIAANKAYQNLKKRLGVDHLPYYIGPSHPNHC